MLRQTLHRMYTINLPPLGLFHLSCFDNREQISITILIKMLPKLLAYVCSIFIFPFSHYFHCIFLKLSYYTGTFKYLTTDQYRMSNVCKRMKIIIKEALLRKCSYCRKIFKSTSMEVDLLSKCKSKSNVIRLDKNITTVS